MKAPDRQPIRPGHRRSIFGTALLLAVFLGLSHSALAQSGALTLELNGSTGSDVDVVLGTDVIFNVQGDPNEVFALAFSATRSFWDTYLGAVEVDVGHPSFRILIDGFTPGSPFDHLGIFDSVGTLEFGFTMFPVGQPVGSTGYFQSIMTSPWSPFGYVLSNLSGAQAIPPAPNLLSVQPKFASVGSSLFLSGSHLGGASLSGATPIVRIDDVVLPVISHSSTEIEVAIPPAAFSGYVRVETPGGFSAVSADQLIHFVSITGSIAVEVPGGGAAFTTHTTLLGQLSSPLETDHFQIFVNVGDEIQAEILAIDPGTLEPVSYSSSQYGIYLDPELKITIDGAPDDVYLLDENSGPGFNATIGRTPQNRFLAPYTGVYGLSVASEYSFSTGHYVLNVRTALARETPPIILGLHPNCANPATAVEVYAYGFADADISSLVIEFPSLGGPIPVTPYLNENGRLSVDVPMAAASGNLRLRLPNGATSATFADHYDSYLVVLGSPAAPSIFGISTPILGGQSTIGQITTNFQVDTYSFSMNAGQSARIRALPYDQISGRVIRGAIFAAAPLDPEITIAGITVPGLYAQDVHSGPAFSAEIGGLARPPWIAPFTGQYQLNVRPWFFLSTGSYLLDLRIQ